MDKKLLEYVECVVSLEKSLYTQNQAIDKMNKEIEALGIPTMYEEPNKPGEAQAGSLEGLKTMGGLGLFVGGIVGLANGGFLNGIIFGGFAGIIIYGLYYLIALNAKENELGERYREAHAAYERAVEKDEARVERELTEKSRLEKIMSMMIEKRNSTSELLQEYYGVGIIYPRYRNMVAMCSIFEYFEAGSCDTLREAYNKYDNEVLFKGILSKLDEVVQRLDSIKESQYMLYDAIREGNRISEQLVMESVRQAKLIEKSIDYQALEAGYSAQIASEARFHNQLALYDMWQRERQQ